MVKDALRVGGHGYVTKMDAGAELLQAIRMVSEGKPFVSQRIVSQGLEAQIKIRIERLHKLDEDLAAAGFCRYPDDFSS